MSMPARWRKAALVAHITASVGWSGSVLTFLALAVTGLSTQDDAMARAALLVMEPVGWLAIVPLSLASLATGLISALGTPWGLLRHYWVLAKLTINVVATAILLLYMRTVRSLGDLARTMPVDMAAPRDPSPLLHTTAALILLLLAMILAVYKPRGLTPYGQRRLSRAAAGGVARLSRSLRES